MNYYIQGDDSKTAQIKAAFESKGYDTDGWKFDVGGGFYYTHDGRIDMACGKFLINLIKTHPDYKELELPVEHKFKVGDWLYHNTCGIHPILVKGYSERQGYKVECIKSSYYIQKGVVENEYHLWSIADAKDGDVLVTTKIRDCPFIYRKTSRNNGLAYYYAGVDGDGNFCEGCLKRTLYHFGSVENVVPATKEQRDLLFAKIKEAGYEWDADKKELRKIKPHYNISNFKPFDKVLIRVGNKSKWTCDFFSYYDKGFHCIGTDDWSQCIPFEGNEHLLGTTDMCDEQYINW